jgi:hypothetical protein
MIGGIRRARAIGMPGAAAAQAASKTLRRDRSQTIAQLYRGRIDLNQSGWRAARRELPQG